MSAIHTGHIRVLYTLTGRPVFYGTSEDHAIPGWPEPTNAARVFIPKQRAGSDYDTHVLTNNADADPGELA